MARERKYLMDYKERYLYCGKPVCRICTVENPFAVRRGGLTRAKLSHSPSSIDKFIDNSTWL